MNNKYEIMLIIKPNLKDGELQSLVKKVEKIVSGKIVKKEEWGNRKLAYEIKKEANGIYYLYYVETKSSNIFELEHLVKITNNILRHLVIKHEKEWPYNLKFKPEPFEKNSKNNSIDFKVEKENQKNLKKEVKTNVK